MGAGVSLIRAAASQVSVYTSRISNARPLRALGNKGGHLSPKALYLALGSDFRIFWPTEAITAP